MRGKTNKLLLNTVTSLLYQVTLVICGMIIPRLMITNYGSEVNGLVSSINQFLQMIAFLQLGVGAVMQSSLYKPLAENDISTLSKIMKSGGRFYRKIGYILLVYVVILVFTYQIFVPNDYSWIYTASLIVVLSINSFAQYFFGIANSTLLLADQKGYIYYTIQVVASIINVIGVVLLVKMNMEIQVVKGATALVFFISPVLLAIYVKANYNIDKSVVYTEEPIKQKWNGISQHISAVVLDGTDVIVLSVLSTLSNVSIYNVYNMVVAGIKQLFLVMTNGIQSLLGELWAKKEIKKLEDTFGWFEWALHNLTVYIFANTAILIVPFVKIYTSGVSDANYDNEIFAYLIVLANAIHCLRLPYHVMIKAVGEYKQTQNSYLIAAIMNIFISILMVRKFGLIGVAIGTLISMIYHTLWLVLYNSKNMLKWSLRKTFYQFIIDIVCIVFVLLAISRISLDRINYISWIFMAIKSVVLSGSVMILVNILAYNRNMKKLKTVIWSRIAIKI